MDTETSDQTILRNIGVQNTRLRRIKAAVGERPGGIPKASVEEPVAVYSGLQSIFVRNRRALRAKVIAEWVSFLFLILTLVYFSSYLFRHSSSAPDGYVASSSIKPGPSGLNLVVPR